MNATDRLFNAVRRGDAEGVEVALRDGADAGADDASGVTPLHLAALYGPLAVVDALLANGADANIDSSDLLGDTPLHNAVLRGRADVVSALLGAGAKINIKNCEGETPLKLAIRRGHTEVAAMLEAAWRKRGLTVNKVEIESILSEIKELEALLSVIPEECIIERQSLEARLAKVRAESSCLRRECGNERKR